MPVPSLSDTKFSDTSKLLADEVLPTVITPPEELDPTQFPVSVLRRILNPVVLVPLSRIRPPVIWQSDISMEVLPVPEMKIAFLLVPVCAEVLIVIRLTNTLLTDMPSKLLAVAVWVMVPGPTRDAPATMVCPPVVKRLRPSPIKVCCTTERELCKAICPVAPVTSPVAQP